MAAGGLEVVSVILTGASIRVESFKVFGCLKDSSFQASGLSIGGLMLRTCRIKEGYNESCMKFRCGVQATTSTSIGF